jgi:hypothetical protein
MIILLFILFNLLQLFKNTNSIRFNIINQCKNSINIYSHENQQFINICTLNYKSKCNINYNLISSGLIKTILSENATLFEFTINNIGIWYDISVIPPGSGNCYSYKECKSISNKSSYNIPLSINIKHDNNFKSCQNLTCNKEDCEDAYLYPFDDIKTKFCNLESEFTLIYCYNNLNYNNSNNLDNVNLDNLNYNNSNNLDNLNYNNINCL